ncbi:MAG TPA: valine--tRNA ligase [Terracidiphilus sp.]|nr:valine--tRNA ligase [Terracidiphilus sp.]
MPHDLSKAYDPTAIEDHWAEYWVREKLFAQPTPGPEDLGDKSSFTILLPPPNVTGNLHMGHMFEHTESDILIRWHRMCGNRVLWIPGTDHAGIATQMLVERQITAEGTTRQQMGRDKFVERVWEWRRHYGGAILGQMKRLGTSVDWDREYFTMDERLSVAVREAFVRLYEQGLIYRGAYIVNWCPRCQTAISDLEVVYDEHKGHLWEIRYPVIGDDGKDTGEFLTVATTRPETMLGDVAVAVHPADERYKHLHGKKLRLPLVGREIPVITDEWVSPEFGTGAVKVTPAHDPNDFALGQRHDLPSINVMDDTAHINAEGGVYAGLDRFVARKKIVADLEEMSLLAGVKDHVNNVGHCDRCKTMVEPRLSLQWFVKIQPLADKAIAAVKEGHIKFTPEMYGKTYLNWMENIHDWCISRQLWWGHRIPAWHCAVCHKITVGRDDPTKCAHCGSDQITQSTDVLDTWFSSGLLPVSVFGWPNITEVNRADFDAFYPTSLLVTGFDILFFWVARMIMLGCWFSDDVKMPDGSARTLKDSVPFREVYIHALVRDANREKMSKTKGNVVDPIEIVKQYGTDAVRFTLASMASPGTDIAFNVARTEGYRAFANKIWNAARFIFMNVDRAKEAGITIEPISFASAPNLTSDSSVESRWIIFQFNLTAHRVDLALKEYRFDDAANAIYKFFWGQFCDWYLEIVKLRLDFNMNASAEEALTVLLYVFESSLRLLSPIMPFITEEIWHALYDGKPPHKSIALSKYPSTDWFAPFGNRDPQSAIAGAGKNEMDELQLVINAIRARRKEIRIEEKALVSIKVAAEEQIRSIFHTNADIIQRLARVKDLEFVSVQDRNAKKKHTDLAWQAFVSFDVFVEYEKEIDTDAEREKLNKEIARQEKIIANSDRQLNNPGFTAKAPAHIVEGLKKQRDDAQQLLDKLRRDLDSLPPA